MGPKYVSLGYKLGSIWKIYCHILNQLFWIFQISKFCEKVKIFKFGSKNSLFGCFAQHFCKAFVIFNINTIKFVLLRSLVQKLKSLNSGPKIPDFGYFSMKFENTNYCYIKNPRPRVLLIEKFRVRIKMPKFGTKNNLFVYLWAGILRNYCDIWNQRICLTENICTKIKISKIETKKKKASFGYFWAGTSRNYCRISIQIPRICLTTKCHAKMKLLNLEPKMPRFVLQFGKAVVIFEVSTFKFVWFQNLMQQ